VNTWRTLVVGLLIVALPLSATASFSVRLSCPHQGLGAAMEQSAHDRAAMASMHHHGGAASGHHACDCVHHCAGANQAFAAPVLAFDGLTGSSAAPAHYRPFHSDSPEPPLLRPPIAAPAA
jgi:hypothetical protein